MSQGSMRHPEWIKVSYSHSHKTKKVLRRYNVNTVCEEARCPNQGRCFSRSSAAFMILGDRCTRNCSFCAVHLSRPLAPDPDEPERVANVALTLGLEFVVITSVTRDDLHDGGAAHYAKTINAIKERKNDMRIEVLTPDFQNNRKALNVVLDAGPNVFNHNVETVPSLYAGVRPEADYSRSVSLLERAKKRTPTIKIKSGIMVGLGEKKEEVISVMKDLIGAGCDYLTIGQYLRPRLTNIPVVEYIKPEVFEQYRIIALEVGFKAVLSSPLARSSMDAETMYSGRI